MDANGLSHLQVEVESMEVDIQEGPVFEGVEDEDIDMLKEDPGELCRSPRSLVARTHPYLSCYSNVVRTEHGSRATRLQ